MKISVIIPVYNVEGYLANTLNGVLAQAYDDLEIILVDDGSKDGSGAICDDYAARYPDVIRVCHIPNGGASNARNLGLSLASGEYVHFVDSDDLLEAGMYEEFASIARSNAPDLIVCGCKRQNTLTGQITLAHSDQKRMLGDRGEIGAFLDGLPSKDKRWLLDYIWNKWYKRSFLVEHAITYDPAMTLGEDFLLNCRVMMQVNSIYVSDQPYYDYIIRGSGLVTAFQPEPWVYRLKLAEAHKALYECYGIYEANAHAIKVEDGMLAFSALRSVNSPRCKLNKAEKRTFLQTLYRSKLMELARYYLKHSPKKLHRLWLVLISAFGLFGVRLVVFADSIDRKRKG